LTDPKTSALLHCINQISFFEGFSSIEKETLLKKVSMFKKYDKKGTIIFSEEQKGSSMYVILEGVIAITRASFANDKKEQFTLAKLKKGSVFGEIALLSNQSRTTSASTDSPLVILMVIDKQTLEGFDLGIQKIFHTKMIETLIRRLDDMNKKYRNSKV
jgi:CRP-like cAMP-binding protein